MLKRFRKDATGASSAEYALILAVVGSGLGVSAYYLKQAVTATVGNTVTQIVAEDSDSGGATPTPAPTPAPSPSPTASPSPTPSPSSTPSPDPTPSSSPTPPGKGKDKEHGKP